MPRKDYTSGQYAGTNPAWDMQRLYSELMDAIDRVPELGVARVIGILDDWTGRGISAKNAMKWKRIIQQAFETGRWGGIRNDPAAAVQKAVTDFILAGSGMAANPGRRQPRMEAHIQTMANLMNEDGGYRMDIDASTISLIKLFTDRGYVVSVNEGFGPYDAGMADAGMAPEEDEMGMDTGMEEPPCEAQCPVAELIAWARENGCPEELCMAAEEAQGGEGPIDGMPPEGPVDEMPPVDAADETQLLGMESKQKPSAGLTKKQKSNVAKKAAAGKDIGKKGKGFKKVEAAAKKSGAKDPAAVAGAAMWKNIPRGKK